MVLAVPTSRPDHGSPTALPSVPITLTHIFPAAQMYVVGTGEPDRLLRSMFSTMRLLKALGLLYEEGRLPDSLLSSRVMTWSCVNTLFHPQLLGRLPPMALLDRFLKRKGLKHVFKAVAIGCIEGQSGYTGSISPQQNACAAILNLRAIIRRSGEILGSHTHMICRVVSWMRLSGRLPLSPMPFRFLQNHQTPLKAMHIFCGHVH